MGIKIGLIEKMSKTSKYTVTTKYDVSIKRKLREIQYYLMNVNPSDTKRKKSVSVSWNSSISIVTLV